MANNSKLYEKMWAIVNGPRENAPTEWEALAKSDNLDDNETCFLLAIVLEAIHHGYNIGVDYTYEQGMRDVHVDLDSSDSDFNNLDSAYEPPTSPTNNAIE